MFNGRGGTAQEGMGLKKEGFHSASDRKQREKVGGGGEGGGKKERIGQPVSRQ
jgi:hypothetical protein